MIRWKLWHVKRHDTWKLIENTENTERSERTLQIKAHVSALMFSAQNWHGNDVNNVNMRNELTEITVSIVAETPRLKRLVLSWRAAPCERCLAPRDPSDPSDPSDLSQLPVTTMSSPGGTVERWNGGARWPVASISDWPPPDPPDEVMDRCLNLCLNLA